MSYIVLARKWRPQSFDELIGQNTVRTILKNAVSQGRIAHAYLFSGPRGVGKTSTARILAKSLNCTEGPTITPCNNCQSCKSITEGYAVDVMEIDGASNNSVEDIRDLRERVKYAPTLGRYKVYIIDESHMLSQSAFNALLKTLEEPPPHVVFVLATTAPQKIPVTVISRCQHLPFHRVKSADIKAHLKRITEREGIRITDEALEMIVRAADGSMRDSLTLLDQISAFADEVTQEDVSTLLGLSDSEMVVSVTDAVLKGDRKGIVSVIEQAYEQGMDPRMFYRDILQFVRSFLIAYLTDGDNLDELSEVEKRYIKENIRNIKEEHLTTLLSELARHEAEVRTAFSPRVALEMMLLRVSYLSELRPVGDIIKQLQRFDSALPEADPPVVEESQPARADKERDETEIPNDLTQKDTPVKVPSTTTMDAWKKLVERIEQEDAILASKLKFAMPSVEGDLLSLTLNGGHAFLSDSIREKVGRLHEVITSGEIEGFKGIKRIEVVKKKALKGELKTETAGKRKITPEEEMIIRIFGARIIERRKRDVKKDAW